MRFSSEDCAKWCKEVEPKCERWVFREIGSTCYLKFKIEYLTVRDAQNPLTEEDKNLFENEPKVEEKTEDGTDSEEATEGEDSDKEADPATDNKG